MIGLSIKKSKPYLGDKKVKKGYVGATKVYSAGNWVTYHIDTGNTESIEVDEGNDVLHPSVFTPTKPGWTFKGWREDTYAADSWIDTMTMGDEPITLYAVYEQEVKCSFVSYTGTTPVNGYRYYNASGETENATVTVPAQGTYSGWSNRGWADAGITEANASPKWKSGNKISGLTSAKTYYALYDKTVTVTYYNNSNSATKATETAYYNASNDQLDAPFTLTQSTGNGLINVSGEGWQGRGWSTTNSGSASITYNNGATFRRSSNVTLYGLYQKTNYLYYSGNGSTGGSTATQSGIHYWAPAGHIYPSVVLAANGFTRSGYSFTGWNLGTVGTTITLTGNMTASAQWMLSKVNVYTAQEVNTYYKYTGTLANSEYVTYSFSENPLHAGAHVNSDYGSEDEQQNHGTITINYGGYYTRAVIELYDGSNNEYNNDREAWYRYWISGNTAPGWQSITNSVHTITMYASSGQTVLNLGARANINGDNGGLYTWVDSALAIKSITLYN